VIFHAGLQKDTVGPDVDVSSRQQIALLPALVLACHSAVSREITAGDKFGAFWPRSAASASWKSPVEMPRK
jgi:hypothetical protein